MAEAVHALQASQREHGRQAAADKLDPGAIAAPVSPDRGPDGPVPDEPAIEEPQQPEPEAEPEAEEDADPRAAAFARLARENEALREKNQSDGAKLQQLAVMTAAIGRDIERLCTPRQGQDGRDQRNAQRRAEHLAQQNELLAKENRELQARADAGEQAEPRSPRRSRSAKKKKRGGGAEGDPLRRPSTLKLLDQLLAKENHAAALRHDIGKLQASLREHEPDRVAVAKRAIEHELALVQAKEARRLTEAELVARRYEEMRASAAELVERATTLRRRAPEEGGESVQTKLYALLEKERAELEAEVAETLTDNQRLSALAAERTEVRDAEVDQWQRLSRRMQLTRLYAEGLRGLLKTYMHERAGLRGVLHDRQDGTRLLKDELARMEHKRATLTAQNHAAETLLGLLELQKGDGAGEGGAGGLRLEHGGDAQLRRSVRTVEEAIRNAGGERAWEAMAEVLWRVRQQVGGTLTEPVRELAREVMDLDLEVAKTQELLRQQESLGGTLVASRSRVADEAAALYGRSMQLGADVEGVRRLESRLTQLNDWRQTLRERPKKWRQVGRALAAATRPPRPPRPKPQLSNPEPEP